MKNIYILLYIILLLASSAYASDVTPTNQYICHNNSAYVLCDDFDDSSLNVTTWYVKGTPTYEEGGDAIRFTSIDTSNFIGGNVTMNTANSIGMIAKFMHNGSSSSDWIYSSFDTNRVWTADESHLFVDGSTKLACFGTTVNYVLKQYTNYTIIGNATGSNGFCEMYENNTNIRNDTSAAFSANTFLYNLYGSGTANLNLLLYYIGIWNGSLADAPYLDSDYKPPTVHIVYPTGDLHIRDNIYINVSNDFVRNCSINDSRWGLDWKNTTFSSYLNNTGLSDGYYSINVNCSDADGLNSSNATRNFYIDTTNPIISPDPDLENNNTLVWNGTLNTYINFSDNQEIYSINVTLGNGTIISNLTNIGSSWYYLNISHGIGGDAVQTLNARVCDAHTAKDIKEIDVETYKSGLVYVMKETWGINQEWIHIYPKDHLSYNKPSTTKFKDRYSFEFDKKLGISPSETFVVESSHFIDIIKSDNYGGHLVIPNINKGYWVDFENNNAKGYSVKRINNNKVEITVTGLSNSVFESIGELNCINETYYFANLNSEVSYTQPTYSQSTSTVYLNISEGSLTPTINATLYYNNTAYNVGNNTNFTQTITAPSLGTINFTNISLYWVISTGGNTYTLPTYNQTVYNFYIDNCSSAYSIALNYTFYDEENNSIIPADVTGTFNYSIDGAYKQYSIDYSDVTNFTLCIYPPSATLTGDYYLYYSSTDYPLRRYYDTTMVLTNSTSNIALYLLHSALGIYAWFQILDVYSNPLSDVLGTMQRLVSGDYINIERETSDDSGLTTFWVNPDQDYRFTFSLTGYETETFNLRPTTSEVYSVILGGGLVTYNQSYGSGISYTFRPTTSVLNNDTIYNFTFNLTSSHWTVTDCTLYIKNSTDTLTSSSTSYTDTTCNISINYNTGNHDEIITEAIYFLNGTSQTTSRSYSIIYTYEGDASLKNFLDDLNDFGEMGFNDYTRMILAFIAIFVLVYLTASKSIGLGVQDEEALVILTIVLVWVFSYIEWLTIPYGPIPSDFLNKWILFIIVLLIGGSYLIKKHID